MKLPEDHQIVSVIEQCSADQDHALELGVEHRSHQINVLCALVRDRLQNLQGGKRVSLCNPHTIREQISHAMMSKDWIQETCT